jgi:hypothetical protein
MRNFWLAFAILVTPLAHAESKIPKDANCAQIYQACQNAGFIVGEAKEGKGLWMDCVDPIMQGIPPKKSVLPLPSVSPQVVASCKAKHPRFGSGKIG